MMLVAERFRMIRTLNDLNVLLLDKGPTARDARCLPLLFWLNIVVGASLAELVDDAPFVGVCWCMIACCQRSEGGRLDVV